MLVVLADAGDAGAAAIWSALVRRVSAREARLVHTSTLATAGRFTLTLSPDGRAGGGVSLAGEMIGADSRSVVLNRMLAFPHPRFAQSGARDRDYAAAEIAAILAAWLAALPCRVIDRLSPPLATPPSPRMLLHCAASAGLRVGSSAFATAGRLVRAPGVGGLEPVDMAQPIGSDAIVVAAGRAYGPRAREFGDACVEAAARAGRDTAAFGFAEDAGEPLVVAAQAPPGVFEMWHADAIADAMISARAAP